MGGEVKKKARPKSSPTNTRDLDGSMAMILSHATPAESFHRICPLEQDLPGQRCMAYMNIYNVYRNECRPRRSNGKSRVYTSSDSSQLPYHPPVKLYYQNTAYIDSIKVYDLSSF